MIQKITNLVVVLTLICAGFATAQFMKLKGGDKDKIADIIEELRLQKSAHADVVSGGDGGGSGTIGTAGGGGTGDGGDGGGGAGTTATTGCGGGGGTTAGSVGSAPSEEANLPN